MSVLPTLLALAGGLGLTGLTTYAVVHSHRSARRGDVEGWEAFAHSRGLRLLEPARGLFVASSDRGNDGLDRWSRVAELERGGVRMRLRFETRQNRNFTSRACRVDAFLDPPLDLHLGVRAARFRAGVGGEQGYALPQGMADWLHDRGLGQRSLGDPELERWFTFEARDPERLQALITPRVREALHAAAGAVSVQIGDRFVSLERHGELDPEAVDWALDHAVTLVHALREAALRVPPAAETRPYLPVYEQAARALGFHYTQTPAALGGMLDGVHVSCAIVPQRLGTAPIAQVQATIPEPLGLGLALRPAQDGGLGLSSPRDVQLGDALLDDKLDIHGSDAESIRAVFPEPARALLHELRDRGRLYIDDHFVRLDAAGSLHPQDLLPTLHKVRELAATLNDAARTLRMGGARAAYR